MHTPSKKSISAVILLCLGLIITSCGDNKNKTNSSTYSNSGPLNPSDYTQYNAVGFSGAHATQVQQAKSQLGCKNGTRISQDATFYVSGYASNSRIGGQMQPGVLQGEVESIYIGVSVFNDLIFVSKVVSGTQVLGYNVTLSMCSYQNIYLEARPITGFVAAQGITLGSSSTCAFGQAISRDTYVQVSQFQYNGNSGASITLPAVTNTPTSFASIVCR